MGHKGPSFWREQPYIMYMILKAFLTVDFFTPWSIYTTDWAERKTYENVKILEYALLNLNLKFTFTFFRHYDLNQMLSPSQCSGVHQMSLRSKNFFGKPC